MKNSEISRIFRDIASILEIKGENVFRIRAYERAAQNIEGLSGDIQEYVDRDTLREIPGIGLDLSEKIKEYLSTGKIKVYEELKKNTPEGLLDLLNIPGVGPKTAKLLYEKLEIASISDLEAAITKKKLVGLPGVKAKTIENILKGIAIVKKAKVRMPLLEAMRLADAFIGALSSLPQVEKISCAGSLRRQKETVRDIDILVISAHPEVVMDAFVNISSVKEILSKGQTKASVRTDEGVQVDCRVVEGSSFGAALLYFTGSKNFNIKIRQLALKNGLKVNEYGVFKKDNLIATGSEQDVFKILKLPYIEPELREDTGEIELARDNKLPVLVELKDIKGDLHAHSDWSDGLNTIDEMSAAAQKRGYEYIAITDHSQGLKVAGGLSVPDLKKKRAQIDKLNKNLKSFRILFGTEVDIEASGKLDYPDSVLKEFDVVVAAIHSGFKLSMIKQTKRLIRACENKYVNIIAHPTGRLWGVRDPYELDFNELFKAAAQTNTHLEINSFSQRLDLNDVNARHAKTLGVKLTINTDSHTIEQLDSMKLGVSVGRRGWLTKEDVINTLGLDELLKTLRK